MLLTAAFPLATGVLALELAFVVALTTVVAALVLVLPTVLWRVVLLLEKPVDVGATMVELDEPVATAVTVEFALETGLLTIAVLGSSVDVAFADAEGVETAAKVVDTGALADADEEDEEPPLMWNGKEYWKMVGAELSCCGQLAKVPNIYFPGWDASQGQWY